MRSVFTSTGSAVAMESWQLEMGARVLAGGSVRFRVWAPGRQSLAVQLGGRVIPFEQIEAGLWQGFSEVGGDYTYLLDRECDRPDPVSRWQPCGVHGASRVYDPQSFHWTDAGWRGLPLEQCLFYELHVGTFTPEGTFQAIIPRLAYLKELGVTALSLMPVGQFPGSRNWGYDAVNLFAPHASYGGPEGLKQLVDACHSHGLAVVLDVVYNHLGLEGNYLHDFGPYFTDRYPSSWSEAINFDGPESNWVRRYFIDNALYWITEYHMDGLRLDAVHAIYDFGARHILSELAEAVQRQAALLGRQVHVIAESDLNDVRVIAPRDAGGYGLDAQWQDDFHHAAVTAVTGRREGYLVDFGTLDDLAKAFSQGYVVDGRFSPFRRRRHGSSSRERPGKQFITFIQNHDQIANASQGRRIAQLATLEQQRLLASLMFCGPGVPLLFMGEEWAASTPFRFFASYEDPHLAAVIAESHQGASNEHGFVVEPYNPQDPQVFADCKLRWEELGHEPHRGMFNFYRDLCRLRRELPVLSDCCKERLKIAFSQQDGWLTLERYDLSGCAALLVCNFRSSLQAIAVDGGPWTTCLETADPRFGGAGLTAIPRFEGAADISLRPFSAAIYKRG